MNKKTVICTGLVLAALFSGILLAGCDMDYSDEGRIRVRTDSDTKEYWVKIGIAPQMGYETGSVDDNFSHTFFDIYEEGYYTVYYCEKYEDETIDMLEDRIWHPTDPVYVTIGEIIEVYVPY